MDLVIRVVLQPGVTERKELLVPKDSSPGLEITTFISLRRQLHFIVYTQQQRASTLKIFLSKKYKNVFSMNERVVQVHSKIYVDFGHDI